MSLPSYYRVGRPDVTNTSKRNRADRRTFLRLVKTVHWSSACRVLLLFVVAHCALTAGQRVSSVPQVRLGTTLRTTSCMCTTSDTVENCCTVEYIWCTTFSNPQDLAFHTCLRTSASEFFHCFLHRFEKERLHAWEIQSSFWSGSSRRRGC